MQNWKIPNYVKTYDHIDLVINDKKQELLDLVSEINHDIDNGYEMGVYLCLGQQIWETNQSNALDFSKFNNFTNIHIYLENNDKVLILLGKGIHKIKKKAEQIACEIFINKL